MYRTLALLLGLWMATPAVAQIKEQSLTREAGIVLTEIMRVPDKGIPRSLMQEAQAIMIFPEVIKAGFIVGGRRGSGVVLLRDEQGLWGYPVALTITGGSIGGQIGIQSTDLVLMFKSKRGVDSILRGRHLTLGADASVSAGPVGRTLAASTDTSFRTEILSWSRSRGLFAGVAVDGSKVKLDHGGTAAFYTTPNSPAPPIEQILNGQVQSVPAVANDLRNQLNQLAPPPELRNVPPPPAK
ncbi:MAG TPA: lipid-binding SYLF domain-containing protein [Gemmatales bacterium]|nr:lipid-binding SYLF domain-containing protein [Gemmatales bacterium]